MNFVTRVWFERKGRKFFFVLYFSACPDPLRLEMKPRWYFLIFRIFLYNIFSNFLTWVGFERIGMNFFFSLFFGPSWPVSSWNEAWMMFFNFSNFFAFVFEFSNSGWVLTDRKEIFFVHYFSPRPDPSHLEMKPGWCFLIFKIFLHLFLNFLIRVGFERVGRKFCLFSIFRPVHTQFVLQWSLDEVF